MTLQQLTAALYKWQFEWHKPCCAVTYDSCDFTDMAIPTTAIWKCVFNATNVVNWDSTQHVFTKPLWLHIKLWNRTSGILTRFASSSSTNSYSWDSPVNYYSVSQRQGTISNTKHSVSRHQLSGTLCLCSATITTFMAQLKTELFSSEYDTI